MKKAIIKKVSHGKLKGQYRFILIAANGEPIADARETYTQKHNVTELLATHFSDFEVVDKTKE